METLIYIQKFTGKGAKWGLLICVLTWCGCRAVPLNQQRLVSKPNMTFSDSPVFAYQSTMLSQIEPGTASSGGAQAAGCTACQ